MRPLGGAAVVSPTAVWARRVEGISNRGFQLDVLDTIGNRAELLVVATTNGRDIFVRRF